MTETLSDALHARLDQMGAPARETPPAEHQPGESRELPPEPALELVQGGQAETISELGESPQGAELDGDTEAGLDDQQQPEGETPQRYKAAEFAEAIGWEPGDLYTSLEIPINDAGETLTLGEIKDQYGELAANRAAVEQAQAVLQAERERLQQAAQQQFAGSQELSAEIQQAYGKVAAIEQQYGQVPWQQLEAEDPGKAANARQKFATAYAAAKSELETAQGKHAEQRQQTLQQFVAQQQQRVTELVPEWKDEKVYAEENPQISEYMLNRGFSADELPHLYHAGLRAMARDGWRWRQHVQEVQKAKGKMTRRAPKQVLRPGGPQVASASSRMAQELESRALETGNSQDKLAAAKAIVQSSMRKR